MAKAECWDLNMIVSCRLRNRLISDLGFGVFMATEIGTSLVIRS